VATDDMRRQDRLFGILKRVDHEDGPPARSISQTSLFRGAAGGKRKNKGRIAKGNGLPVAADVPLFGTITRLAEQKGVDIQLARSRKC